MHLTLTRDEADTVLHWYSWVYSEGAADEKDAVLMLRIKEYYKRGTYEST